MRALAVVLFVFAISCGLPAYAESYPQYGLCDSAGQPALHRVEITGGSALSTFYLDDENGLLGNGYVIAEETNGLWIPKLPGVYLEGLSNENFQRGGSPPWIPGDNDICNDDSPNGPDLELL